MSAEDEKKQKALAAFEELEQTAGRNMTTGSLTSAWRTVKAAKGAGADPAKIGEVEAKLKAEESRLKAAAALQKALKPGDASIDLQTLERALDAAKEAAVDDAECQLGGERLAMVKALREEKGSALKALVETDASGLNLADLKTAIGEAEAAGVGKLEIKAAKSVSKDTTDRRTKVRKALEEATAPSVKEVSLATLDSAIEEAVAAGVGVGGGWDAAVVEESRSKRSEVSEARAVATEGLERVMSGEPPSLDLDGLEKAIEAAAACGVAAETMDSAEGLLKQERARRALEELDGALSAPVAEWDVDERVPSLLEKCRVAAADAERIDAAEGRMKSEIARRALATLEGHLVRTPEEMQPEELEALDGSIVSAHAACAAASVDASRADEAAAILAKERRRRAALKELHAQWKCAVSGELPFAQVDVAALQSAINEAREAGVDLPKEVEPAEARLIEVKKAREAAEAVLEQLAALKLSELSVDAARGAVEVAKECGADAASVAASEARVTQKELLDSSLVIMLEAHGVCAGVAPSLVEHNVHTMSSFAAVSAGTLVNRCASLTREVACTLRSEAVINTKLAANAGALAVTVTNFTDSPEGGAVYEIHTAKLVGTDRTEFKCAWRVSEIAKELHLTVRPALAAAKMPTSFPLSCPRWLQTAHIKRKRVYSLETYFCRVIEAVADETTELHPDTRHSIHKILMSFLNVPDSPTAAASEDLGD